MYSRNSFGSFYPVDSAIHRLNPVIKLFNFIVCILILLLSNTLSINIFILCLVIIMMFLSFVPLKYYMNTFWSLRYIYILIAFVGAYFNQTLEVTMVYIIKLICVVEYLNILAYTTSPSESAYGIEKFMSLFNFLSLNISKFAFKINQAIRYVPLSLAVEYKTLKASASRGIDYNHSNIFGRWYALSKMYSNINRLTRRKNKDIAFSSELRLFNIRKFRTNYRVNRVGFYDIFFTLFHLVIMYAVIIEKGLL